MLLYYVITFSILFYVHLNHLYQEGLPPLQRQTDVCPWRRYMPPGHPSRSPGADRHDGALLVWSMLCYLYLLAPEKIVELAPRLTYTAAQDGRVQATVLPRVQVTAQLPAVHHDVLTK